MRILYHHRTRRQGVEGVHVSGIVEGFRDCGHQVLEVALVTKDGGEMHSLDLRTSRWRRLAGVAYKAVAERLPNRVFRIAEILYNFISLPMIIVGLLRGRGAFIYDRYAYFSISPLIASVLFRLPIVTEVNIITELRDTRNLAFIKICRYLENIILKNSLLIVVVSEKLKYAIMNKGINEANIFVQPNGCDVTIMESLIHRGIDGKFMEITRNRTVVCFLGRLLQWYRLDRLIDAMAKIHMRYKDSLLMLIGDGPERDRLVKIAESAGIEDAIIFTGEVQHNEALALVGLSDICVIPATNEWTSPVKLFEYMASGKPVVAPRIDSISSIMIDKEHGKLFDVDTFDEMTEFICELLGNETTRLEMGRQARRRIEEKFTWNHAAQNIITEVQKRVVLE